MTLLCFLGILEVVSCWQDILLNCFNSFQLIFIKFSHSKLEIRLDIFYCWNKEYFILTYHGHVMLGSRVLHGCHVLQSFRVSLLNLRKQLCAWFALLRHSTIIPTSILDMNILFRQHAAV